MQETDTGTPRSAGPRAAVAAFVTVCCWAGSRASVLTGRFRVSNTVNGYRVRDALVYGIALPYGQFRPAAEATTGTYGYATIRFIPTANLHTGRNRTIQFFLRARKPGDPLLSGVSSRRLVQATALVR